MTAGGASDPLSDVDLATLRDDLVAWYETNKRSYPWRETTDPYEILVAEVMSQQTQLDRIEAAWHAFLDRWPTVAELAAADRADVVACWSAHRLGYNNRARYLHEAATRIVAEYGGDVPRNPDELQTLMGVGPYTANAVASFAFDAGDAVVDTNVERVLYRVFENVRDAEDPPFDAVASALLPDGHSRVWNNAIMELGGVACQPTPRCDEEACPWRDRCHAYRTGDFTAPDVQTQPTFDGSRRQYRGRIIRTLGQHEEVPLDELGRAIRVDYSPTGEPGRSWLRDILSDLADDGLIDVGDASGEPVVRLQR